MEKNKEKNIHRLYLLIFLSLISKGLIGSEAVKKNDENKLIKPQTQNESIIQQQLKSKANLEQSPQKPRIFGPKSLPKDVKKLNSPNDAQIQAAIERFKKKKSAKEVGEKKPTPNLHKN